MFGLVIAGRPFSVSIRTSLKATDHMLTVPVMI